MNFRKEDELPRSLVDEEAQTNTEEQAVTTYSDTSSLVDIVHVPPPITPEPIPYFLTDPAIDEVADSTSDSLGKKAWLKCNIQVPSIVTKRP